MLASPQLLFQELLSHLLLVANLHFVRDPRTMEALARFWYPPIDETPRADCDSIILGVYGGVQKLHVALGFNLTESAGTEYRERHRFVVLTEPAV